MFRIESQSVDRYQPVPFPVFTPLEQSAPASPPSPPLLSTPPKDPLEEKLIKAVKGNRVNEAAQLLKKGVMDTNGNTLLHMAHSIPMVEMLLKAGYDLKAKNAQGRTPLHLALRDEVVALYLLNKGANPNAVDDEGYTPVDYAWGIQDGIHNRTLFDAFLNNGGRIRTKYNEKFNSLLFVTYEEKHTQAFKHLIALGAPLDCQNEEGGTLLLIASLNGDVETAQELLKLGANPNIRNKNGNTALHLAVDRKHVELAELLILAGADVNLICQYHQTPLHVACIFGFTPLVKLLIAKGANIRRRTQWGTDPLFLAASRKHYDLAEFLMDQGADPRCIDNAVWDSATLIYRDPDAPVSLKMKVKQFFEKNGRFSAAHFDDINDDRILSMSTPLERDFINAHGINPFTWAVFKGQFENVEFLAAQGSNINIQIDEELRTPLMLAVDSGNIPLIQLLIRLGVDLNLRDENGSTALMRALRAKKGNLAKLLIDAGADVNLVDHENSTPIIMAAVMGDVQLLGSLLQKGASPDHYNIYRMTALGVAIDNRQYLAAEFLIQAGASVHLTFGKLSRSPLFWACQDNQPQLVKLMLAKGAQVDVRDNCGWTPLMQAVCKGYDCVEPLLEAGAATDATEYYGQSSLTVSAASCDPKGIAVLAQKLSGQPFFAVLGTFPFATKLIAYLCLHQFYSNEHMTCSQTLLSRLAAFKEPDKVCEELLFFMTYLNPSLARHPLYLEWLVEALKDVTGEEGLHCLVMTATFTEDPETFLSTFKQILPVHTKTDPKPAEEAILKYYTLYRIREGVNKAYALLDKGSPHTQEALKVLIKVGRHRTKEESRILKKVYQEHPELRVHVLKAMWATKPDPHNISGKQRVIAALSEPHTSDQDKCRLLELMNNYDFEGSDFFQIILQLSCETKNVELKRSCALALVHMGKGLDRALEIIQSADWDLYSQEPYLSDDDDLGPFYKWYTFPTYHLHRERMVEIVYEKRAMRCGPELRTQAEAIYEQFKLYPEQHRMIEAFEVRLQTIPASARFVKPLLIYPENTLIFRGLTEKGALRNTLLHDIATTGVGPADLNQMTNLFTARWARIGQLFFTHKLKYITDNGYFHSTSHFGGCSLGLYQPRILKRTPPF